MMDQLRWATRNPNVFISTSEVLITAFATAQKDQEMIRRWWWWWWILFPNSLKIINSSVNWRLEERWELSTLIIADIQFQNCDHKTSSSSSSSSSSLLSKEQQQSWEMTYEETRRCIIYSFFKTKTHTKQVLLPACCSHPNPRTNLSAAGRTQPKEEISSEGIININIITITIMITTTTTHKLPIKDEQLQKTKPRQDKECNNNNNNNNKQGLGLKAHGCFASKEK
jgi:hypothetical protein